MTTRLARILFILSLASFRLTAADTADVLNIESENGFEYNVRNGEAIYRGNVVVTDRSMTLNCQLLRVQFTPKDAQTASTNKANPVVSGTIGGAVSRIEATGDVVVLDRTQGTMAEGSKAVYSAITDKITLEGTPPKVTFKNNNGFTATGGIEYDRAAGVFRGKGQIRSFIAEARAGNLFNFSTRPQ
jgi:lipopolysaccharide export system protein LptA